MGLFALIPARGHRDGRSRPLNSAAKFVNHITERLAGRVKGLTPVFSALLLSGKLASSASKDFFTLPEEQTRQEGDQ
jgi:hypothetical protein